ncbi:MAG TPA: GNAT family N-acetyltransferase [Phycisphaerae bacterium]|nr:GNAT family N-acetyltransferase [Phycisphaerae bacterium]
MMRIEPADPREIRQVLRRALATGHQAEPELEAQVTVFIQYARALNMPLDENWWCIADERRICACTCVTSPGRTAMLMLPAGAASGLDESGLGEFISAVVEAKSRSNLALLQCLTQPEDRTMTAALRRAGFREITLLEYLDADLNSTDVRAWMDTAIRGGPEAGIRVFPYSQGMHKDLSELIAATYAGSLDCPQLADLRSMEDVIAGHRGAGLFDPRRWLFCADGDGPSGCILLNENPLRPALEVVYMGVHPRARRSGVGRRLLREALQLAHREGISRVTLAVDERNEPARRLYQSAGFKRIMRRRAMVHVFGASSSESKI